MNNPSGRPDKQKEPRAAQNPPENGPSMVPATLPWGWTSIQPLPRPYYHQTVPYPNLQPYGMAPNHPIPGQFGYTQPPLAFNVPGMNTLTNQPLLPSSAIQTGNAIPPWKLPPGATPVVATNTINPSSARPRAWKSPFAPISPLKTTSIPVTTAAKAFASVSLTESSKSDGNLGKSTASSGSGQWPPTLRMFVERCFAQCRTDADRDRMEKVLRERIQKVMKENTLYATDWENEPLLLRETFISQKPTVPIAGLPSQAAHMITEKNETGSKRAERAKRFESSISLEEIERQEEKSKKTRKAALLALAEEGIDWDEYSIIGTCQNLEKKYLRLTSVNHLIFEISV